MLAFGGNGGVHVCNLAEALGSGQVLVPPAAGPFSALGLLFADVEHQCIRAYYQAFDTLDLDACNKIFIALKDEAQRLIEADGYAAKTRRLSCSAELKYVGQNTALPLPVPHLPLAPADMVKLAESFAVAHEASFGYRSDWPISSAC